MFFSLSDGDKCLSISEMIKPQSLEEIFWQLANCGALLTLSENYIIFETFPINKENSGSDFWPRLTKINLVFLVISRGGFGMGFLSPGFSPDFSGMGIFFRGMGYPTKKPPLVKSNIFGSFVECSWKTGMSVIRQGDKKCRYLSILLFWLVRSLFENRLRRRWPWIFLSVCHLKFALRAFYFLNTVSSCTKN